MGNGIVVKISITKTLSQFFQFFNYAFETCGLRIHYVREYNPAKHDKNTRGEFPSCCYKMENVRLVRDKSWPKNVSPN